MMRTFSAKPRDRSRLLIGPSSADRETARLIPSHNALRSPHFQASRSLASEAGDTLLEVLVSALLVGLIVVGTFSGLNSTNRATSIDRARSQADALAEQSEEQLRSEPIQKLEKLASHSETVPVTVGKTKYTLETSATYINDATSTASCTLSSTEEANYLRTNSKVTSALTGNKPVEETGVISPPAGSAIIVQVTYAGAAVPGANVVVTGPSPATTPHELETSATGCAIFSVQPGEYNINASKPSFVNPNGFPNTYEDESGSVTRSVYIPAETTSKDGYLLGLAGELEVSFTEGEPAKATTGDSFVVFNTGQSAPRPFPKPFTPGSYSAAITSEKTIFPFPTKDTVYAGSCAADLPTTNGQGTNPEVLVEPGKLGKVTVQLAPINVKVLESLRGKPEKIVENASARLQDEGCGTVRGSTITPLTLGALSHPGAPFGTYSLCVTSTIPGIGPRKDTVVINNNNAKGTPLQKIYLAEEGKPEAGCP